MIIVLLAGTGLFALVGIAYALRWSDTRSFKTYITARGEIGPVGMSATLFASAMGSWILFGPPEAATWGGLPAIAGYSLGAALPSLLYIPLGRRLRRLMPEGHTLTEYVRHRYGRAMHGVVLLVMILYLFVALTAQVTGMSLIVQLVADVPLWLTAGIVLVATVAYTALGGLRASIFTDGVQSLLLLPLLAAGAVGAVVAIGSTASLTNDVADRAPELLRWTFGPGVQGGLALLLGIGAASLFNQGTWQRVYAADSQTTLRRSFLLVAAVLTVVVAGTGLLGLAAVGQEAANPASTALFNLLVDATSPGMSLGVVLLGLTLVMSSADTLLNALASLLAVDLRMMGADGTADTLLRRAQWITVLLAVPVFAIAAQGLSVLYLFLVADLVCAAALVPVFGGLFSTRFTRGGALAGTGAGLLVGGALFPAPGASQPDLLPAFAAALLVPALILFLLRAPAPVFDLTTLRQRVAEVE